MTNRMTENLKKTAGFVLIGLLTFCIFIIVFAPAALVWRIAEEQVLEKVPDLHILRVGGTVWSGEADLAYRQFPTSELNWQVRPLNLLSSEIDSNLHLFGEGHDFVAESNVSETNAVVRSLVGYVDASYINRVSQPQGLTFAGRVDVRSLRLTSDLKTITDAEGEIYWPGGKIISRTRAAGTRVFDLPTIEGKISMRGNVVSLNLHHQSETVVEIFLKPDGWVSVAVKARLFDLANLPWPAGSSPSDTVLEFEEQLLRSNR